MFNALLVAFGYLIGSVSSAVLICRLMNLPDPRTGGSGNPGATNVLRMGGRIAGALTLMVDFGKGTAAVWCALLAGASPVITGVVGLAAFLGHVYPFFFGFRGGKGVATGLGVLLGWSWPALMATVGTWLLTAAVTRISSLSALISFLLAPLYVWALSGKPALALAMAAMTAVTYWRHRGNIQRIRAGEESRIGSRR